jgi:hypothetical protein
MTGWDWRGWGAKKPHLWPSSIGLRCYENSLMCFVADSGQHGSFDLQALSSGHCRRYIAAARWFRSCRVPNAR